jgi:hypothetical protein
MFLKRSKNKPPNILGGNLKKKNSLGMCADSNQLAQVGGGGPVRSYKICFLFLSRVEKGKRKIGGSFVFRLSRPIKSDHVQIKDKTKNIVPESKSKDPSRTHTQTHAY